MYCRAHKTATLTPIQHTVPYPERRLLNMDAFDSNVDAMFSNDGWFPDNPVGSILAVKNASSDNTTIRTHNTYSWYFSSNL